MSTPGKRSAEEAFEAGARQDQNRHTKAKKSKKEREDSNVQRFQEEAAVDTVVSGSAAATNPNSLATEAPTAPILGSTPHPDTSQSGKKKSKQRREESKEKQSKVEQPENPPAEQAESSKTAERRRRRKEKQRQEAAGTSNAEAPSRQGQGDRNAADGVEVPTEPLPEPVTKLNKRRKKHEQVSTDLDAAPEADAAGAQNAAQKSKTKKKKKRLHGKEDVALVTNRGGENLESEVDDNDPLLTDRPLEDRIEPPPADGSMPDGIEPEEEDDASDIAVDPIDLAGRAPLETRIEAPPKKRKHRPGKSQTAHEKWSTSPTVGGALLEHDPILTADDQHLILWARSDVRVYSRSTSLLIRKLQPRLKGADDVVVGCAISRTNSAHLLIATSSGVVSAWNWSEGGRIRKWKVGGGLASILPLSSESNVEHIACVHRRYDEKESTISIRNLDAFSEYPVSTFEILKRKHLSPNILAFEETGVLVATTHNHLVLGYCPGFKPEDKTTPVFYWRELKLPSHLVSFDARSSVQHRAGNTPRVDIAVGAQSGEILVYEDLLFRLMGKEKKNPNAEITARILHWHRQAVSSVKWSSDGNYLISGGRETVLVIWQLDTNNKQFLPHLTSEILNIAVSERGSSYALRLGDNSVMVLSSANLDATTNIPGLAAAADSRTKLAASLHPTHTDRLLVAVPRNSAQKAASAYALQIYDTSAGYELGRQALVRNSTTVVMTGPKGGSNYEPNITHLSVSFDGKWLATVEEWSADPEDLDGVTLTGEDDFEDFGAETCLKIWLYSEQLAEWELVNRVDNPHSRGSVKVLALQSSTSRNEFATAGSDGKVKIWRPRARVRDGVPVRNEQGEQLYNWGAATTISCAITSDGKKLIHYDSAALAYFVDGSVIAASWSRSNELKAAPRWTYLLDTDSGVVCHTAPNICCQGPCSMAFIDRHLISLSSSICVFDTVTASILTQTTLSPKYLGPRHLSANPLDGTIAIAVNPTYGKGPGRLAILDVNNLNKSTLFEQEVPGQIRALLSSPKSQGYTVIDGYMNISHVRRSGRSTHTVAGAGEVRESEDVKRGLDRIFGQTTSQTESQGQQQTERLLTNGTEGVAGKTLEELLRVQTSERAPAVGELFDGVVGLFAASSTTVGA